MKSVVFFACCKNEASQCNEPTIEGRHCGGRKTQHITFMNIFSFFKNLAKTIESEHDEVISLIVESDRIFSASVASTFFFSLRKRTLDTYILARQAKNSLLFINRFKFIDFRRHKKHKFAFLQGFFWFKVK